MYLIQKPHGSRISHEVVYYPATDTGAAGWADLPRDACHYATREIAEQVIANLTKNGVDATGCRVVPDPLPPQERYALARSRDR